MTQDRSNSSISPIAAVTTTTMAAAAQRPAALPRCCRMLRLCLACCRPCLALIHSQASSGILWQSCNRLCPRRADQLLHIHSSSQTEQLRRLRGFPCVVLHSSWWLTARRGELSLCAHSSALQEWGCVGVSEPCSSVLNPSSLLFWADRCTAPASEHAGYDNPPPLVGCCSMCKSTFIKLLWLQLPFLFKISQLIVRWPPWALLLLSCN